MNSTGKKLVLTTFGESHGPAVGGVLDGFPAGIPVNLPFIEEELKRRSTGRGLYMSPRKEDDIPEFLSGIFEGKTTGAPIAFIVRNTGQRSSDYDHLAGIYRPSHADFTWQQKFGIRDHRGGGRASARETVARVIAGALAKIFLANYGISINGWTSSIGPYAIPESKEPPDPATVQQSVAGIPDRETETKCLEYLEQLRLEGDTTGGTVSCSITGIPAGIGEPIFDKLQADIGKAMLSISAVKGFEYGSGFSGAAMRGSAHNDIFENDNGRIVTKTNFSGGIQGGISNGMPVYFKVAFKPVASLMTDQETINTEGKKVILKGKGRHDVCIVPRAIVIVESMAALVIADHMLRYRPM